MQHPKLRLTIPWESIELEAQQQIIRTLALPELVMLAIMPDVHAGYDLCIGGVALLQGAISPSFVGYDIGCGMCHVNTGLTAQELELDKKSHKEKLFERLQEAIPSGLGAGFGSSHGAGPRTNFGASVGTSSRQKLYKESGKKSGNVLKELGKELGKELSAAASDLVFKSASGDKNLDKKVEPLVYEQLASLGSGNHFLEIGESKSGQIGVTIHSGSRRPGYDIASYYMKKGRMLPLNSELGKAYFADMNWAIDFALKNRLFMLRAALGVMGFGEGDIKKFLAPNSLINESHNHAVTYGSNTILHRKGATAAEEGQLGVIPANQRDGVWVTRGLGNKEFLSSASHGAGRKLSRTAAKQKGSTADLEKAMQGIVCRTDKGVLDEAPWAYKNIDDVLAAQNGILVDVIEHFKPLVVLKG